jgi:Zn finger protein HypA/HybF involved in hydrogenase expression
MGSRSNATCRKCRHRFTLDEWGGFHFHLLRCNKCGRTKAMDAARREETNPKVSFEQSQKAIEKKAGKCRCGGKFTFDAKPRCPKCRSTRYEVDEDSIMMYD